MLFFGGNGGGYLSELQCSVPTPAKWDLCCVPSFAVHGWESHQEELAEEGEEEAEEVGGNS